MVKLQVGQAFVGPQFGAYCHLVLAQARQTRREDRRNRIDVNRRVLQNEPKVEPPSIKSDDLQGATAEAEKIRSNIPSST
jgi:hypothetical protein